VKQHEGPCALKLQQSEISMRLIPLNTLFIATALMASSCTAPAKKLDAKLEQEPPVQSRAELSQKAGDAIDQSTVFSVEQKNQLHALQQSTGAQITDLQGQSLKLREALLQDVLAKEYDAKEVGIIKRRMEKVEKKRIAVIFDAVSKANKIMGRQDVARKQELYPLFLRYRGEM
jgi:hypothetical protein